MTMAARSTGPMVAAGAITWANLTIFEPKGGFELDTTMRIVVATGLGAGFLSLVDKASPEIAYSLSLAVLLTVLLLPVEYDPRTKRLRTSGTSKRSPATNALDFLGLK
jgi:hypothetical protein